MSTERKLTAAESLMMDKIIKMRGLRKTDLYVKTPKMIKLRKEIRELAIAAAARPEDREADLVFALQEHLNAD